MKQSGGYFSTSGKDKSVVLRMKDDNDSAEPAASSVAALNLLRLAQFTGRQTNGRARDKNHRAFSPTLSRFPSAMPQMLVAIDFSLNKPRQIVIAGKSMRRRQEPCSRRCIGSFCQTRLCSWPMGADGQKYLARKAKRCARCRSVNAKPAAYVCENFTCKAPVTSIRRTAQVAGNAPNKL